MLQKEIDRINELARKSKTPEGLTAEEKEEQARLRKEYVAAFRKSLADQLEHTVVVEPDGTRHRLIPHEERDPGKSS